MLQSLFEVTVAIAMQWICLSLVKAMANIQARVFDLQASDCEGCVSTFFTKDASAGKTSYTMACGQTVRARDKQS